MNYTIQYEFDLNDTINCINYHIEAKEINVIKNKLCKKT